MGAGTAGSLELVRFIYAVAASVFLVLSAPFMGEVRRWLRGTFPSQFITIVGAVIGLSAVVALALAVSRIREQRLVRYGRIAAAVLLAAIYSRWSALGNPESDIVEQIHFLEYGIVTLLFYRAWWPLGDAGVLLLPLLAGIAVGTCEEWFQWFIPVRVGEVRDIFLNVAAIVSGLLFSTAVIPPVHFKAQLGFRARTHAAIVAAFALVLLTGFVTSAHVGYEIEEPEIGRFKSIQDAEALRASAQDRARRWTSEPPLSRPARLSREDQYMSEGLLHVQERNRRWGAGDVTAAWFENRILEKYFQPVLDIPSYVSRTGHRWPVDHRADAERRAVHDPRAFVSQAQGSFPIFTWRKPVVWTVSLVMTCCVLLVARYRTPA